MVKEENSAIHTRRNTILHPITDGRRISSFNYWVRSFILFSIMDFASSDPLYHVLYQYVRTPSYSWRSLSQGRILTVARCSIMSYDDHIADKTNYQDGKTM